MAELKWWQTGVFYQIYPRSFADGNGDGIGDLQGMIARLDYLQDLGVDAVWLSPHYPSPQYDCGYDISDYVAVAPEYGTLDDFKRFLEGAHRRGIRVILDLVLNHTSHQHPWFIASQSSRDHPKRHWYIWRDGVAGRPPNNWLSRFGGSAWEHDSATGQYYYHYFFKEQSDLNWRNPQVRGAMWDAVRFWLDLGADGFRLDAISTIFEDPALPDHSAGVSLSQVYRAFQYEAFRAASRDPEKQRRAEWAEAAFRAMFQHQRELPEVHELVQELRGVVDEYPGCVLVGESDEVAYYGDGTNELHLVFNFPLMRTDQLTPAWVRANQAERLSALPPGAWPGNTLNNHDSPRAYTRYGDGRNDDAIARISLALMLTLRGTPFLYNGEEIGMTDLLLKDINQFRDNLGAWLYHSQLEDGVPPDVALAVAARFSRDKCRTPVQWANAPNAGFCPVGVEPWLPVNLNYAQGVNVAEQIDDPDSLLNFYRRMLNVRRQTSAVVAGDYVPLHEEAEDCLAFLRRSEEQVCLVVFNMSDRTHRLDFDLDADRAHLVFSSRGRQGEVDDLSQLKIAPFEVYVGELAGKLVG